MENSKLRGANFKDSVIENFDIINSDLNRTIFENCGFKKITFDKCKMFMFMCYNTNFNTVLFNNSNLTLSKFLSCEKKDTIFSSNNKMLCMYEKSARPQS